MLTLRKEQMDAFGAYMLEQNLKKMVLQFETTRKKYYLEMGPERSSEFVHSAVKQGLAWGIRKLKDVWALIDIMLEFGEDFAASPERAWAQGILKSESMSGSAKIKLVTAHLRGLLD